MSNPILTANPSEFESSWISLLDFSRPFPHATVFPHFPPFFADDWSYRTCFQFDNTPKENHSKTCDRRPYWPIITCHHRYQLILFTLYTHYPYSSSSTVLSPPGFLFEGRSCIVTVHGVTVGEKAGGGEKRRANNAGSKFDEEQPPLSLWKEYTGKLLLALFWDSTVHLYETAYGGQVPSYKAARALW